MRKPLTLVGALYRNARLNMGVSASEVAEAVGVSRQAISNWEIGASEPSVNHKRELLNYLKINPEDLKSAKSGKTDYPSTQSDFFINERLEVYPHLKIIIREYVIGGEQRREGIRKGLENFIKEVIW